MVSVDDDNNLRISVHSTAEGTVRICDPGFRTYRPKSGTLIIGHELEHNVEKDQEGGVPFARSTMTASSDRGICAARAEPHRPGGRWLAQAAILLAFAPAALSSTPYCAIEVKVATPSGAAFAHVPVYLIRSQHTTLSSTTTGAHGEAKFCDVPQGPLDIGVGFDVCGSVLVRDVRATWPETRTVFITYARTPCGHFSFDKRCLLVLHVHDEKGNPIPGARLDVSDHALSPPPSDPFGRIFHPMEEGKTLHGAVMKPGYVPAHVSQTCRSDPDVTIALRKK